VVAFNWRPWKASDANPRVSQLQVLEPATNSCRPLSEISPLVGALAQSWEQSLQVLAFVVNGDELKDSGQLDTVRKAVLDRIRSFVDTASESSKEHI
jgi:hypothetical protein